MTVTPAVIISVCADEVLAEDMAFTAVPPGYVPDERIRPELEGKKETALAQLLDDICRPGLFGGGRLVLINEERISAEVLTILRDAAQAIADAGSIVIMTASSMVNRGPGTEQKGDAIVILDAQKPWERERVAKQTIQAHARALGIRLSSATVQRLWKHLGEEYGLVKNEVTKLSLYIGEGGTVTEDDIELLVRAVPESNVYRFIEAFENGSDEMLRLFDEVTLEEDGLNRLLGLWPGRLYALYQLAVKSVDESDIKKLAQETELKDWLVKKILPFATRSTPAHIAELLDVVLSVDAARKTGRLQTPGDVRRALRVRLAGFVETRTLMGTRG